MNEYFELEHVEPVSLADLGKPPIESNSPCTQYSRSIALSPRLGSSLTHFPSPLVVYQLNDTLFVGSTIHLPLIDVLLRFQIVLTADMSKMYRAITIKLVSSDRDLHQFTWKNIKDPLINSYNESNIWCFSIILCGQYGSQAECYCLCHKVPNYS